MLKKMYCTINQPSTQKISWENSTKIVKGNVHRLSDFNQIFELINIKILSWEGYRATHASVSL